MSKRILVLLVAVLSCFASTLPAFSQTPTARDPAISSTAAIEYKLGPGDKIRIIVFGEPDLGGEFVVSGEGTVSLPLIGDQRSTGLTSAQLQKQIEASLSDGYLKDPRVNVEVLTFRPFYILGEVTSPGEYAYSNGLTVLNAVARASGFTYRADKRKVYIKRAGENDERSYPLTTSTLVEPGDTVRIGERYF